MSRIITAAVSRADDAPLGMEELRLGAPRPDEIVVEVAYAGICQTDIKAMRGKQGTHKPVVLGHEGVGTVVEVGSAVPRFAPGSRVLMTFASCGACPACDAALPSYCRNARPLNMNGARGDGSSAYESSEVHSHFFGQSSFATHSITAARNAVAIPDDVPFEVAGAMGCGVMTGAGTVLNVLPLRPGASLVVLGAGAVGLSAVMAARIAGASRIIAVDVVESRLDVARSVGATHALNARNPDLVQRAREITGGGAGFAVEASGVPAALDNALAVLGTRGMCAVAGAAGDVEARFRWRDLQLRGLTIRGVIEGDVNPPVFMPRLMRHWSDGCFPVDRLVRLYDFAQINTAIADAEAGKTIKPLLRIAHEHTSH